MSNSFGQANPIRLIGIRQNDDKFLAAVTRRNIAGAYLRLDALRELAQDGVPGRMTPGVVDTLEAIDIQHQANQVGTITLRARQFLNDAHLQVTTVVPTG